MKRINASENFEALVFAESNKDRRLRSVHNYDILANPIYSDRFMYVPCVYPRRSDYVVSEY